MKKKLFCIVLFLVPVVAMFAQQHTNAPDLKQFHSLEDSLKLLSRKFAGSENDMMRMNANYTFIKTLVSALKISDSFRQPLDSIKNISIVTAPDNRFRIIAWHILNDDGSYRYYGAIQMNAGGTLKLYPLEDYSPLLSNPQDSVTDNHKWFGAQYYKIIQPTAEANYVLLGWKGNTNRSTKKVIDVLSFRNGSPVFGMPIFNGNGKTRDRVVFEFSKDASMMLKYIPANHTIVFDHLSASDPKNEGKPDTYGPDMSYSGYKFKDGYWIYTDNLDMRNMPGAQDEQYADPKQKTVNTGGKKNN